MPHADGYTKFVNKPVGSRVAKTLGLPRPVPLIRHTPGEQWLTGPVLVLGQGSSANNVAQTLFDTGHDVRRDAGIKQKFSAVLVILDDISTPADISEPILHLGSALRGLASNGRVVFVARDPESPVIADQPEQRAARQAVIGVVRSVGQEMREGATTNGILLADGVDINAPAAQGALNFLLSGRSAYVSGQFIFVGTDSGLVPEDPDQPLANKVVVVTGAARGIGADIARVLHRDGAKIVGVDMPQAGEALAQVMNEVRGTSLQMDITAEDSGERIIEHCKQRHGQLDAFVHNAGITRDKLLANMDVSRWDSVLNVNLLAPLRINEALLNQLGEGTVAENLRIVSLASTSGIAGNRGQTNYAASKAGVIGLTAAAAHRLSQTGGSINAVAPGFIETEMTAKMPTATREVARRLAALRQGGLPVDVAETIGFFLWDSSAGINGTTLRVCGHSMVGA